MRKLLLFLLFIPLFLYGQNPQINAILVNSCTVSEGLDELVVFTNGTSNLSINNITITFPSLTPYCNSGCGTQTLLNNATYVNSLNTLAGCSLFQYSTTIPPGAKVVVFTGLNPSMVYNYSSECGNGPYYVVFCNNASTTGRFANNAGANRTLSINFGTSTDAVTFFSSNANTGDDGDYVTFTDAGAPTYSNIGTCAIPLPIELLEFKGNQDGDDNLLQWSTASERDNDYFMLEKSVDGINWIELSKISGAGNSTEQQNYQALDYSVDKIVNYYRLKQVDFNGEFNYIDIISIDNRVKNKHVIRRINLIGQEISENTSGFVIEIYSDGTSKKIFKL